MCWIRPCCCSATVRQDNPIEPIDWKIAFEDRSRIACADRALVLEALSIPHEIVLREEQFTLLVPAGFLEKAKYELWQYDRENRPTGTNLRHHAPVYQDAIPGVVGYALLICFVAWLANAAAFDRDWFAAGRIDGELIRSGEWWRSVTALSLHASARHLAGNLGFGVIFGLLAGSLVGSGVAWFGVLVASALANITNTMLLDSTHRAIGASTAVFAALGLVAGFSWRAKLMAQDRWAYKFGPIVGGLALLAYTGTGDENTDIGAHLLGFVFGFGSGMLLTAQARYLTRPGVQTSAGGAAVAAMILAWTVGLGFLG